MVLLQAAATPASAVKIRKTSKIRDHFLDAAMPKESTVETFAGWDADVVKHLKKMAVQDACRKKLQMGIKIFSR